MKKLLCFLLILVIAIPFTACRAARGMSFDESDTVSAGESIAPTIKQSSVSPLLWKVTNKNSDAVLWLFGTISLADESAYPLPEEVMSAYESSKILVVMNNYIDDKVDSEKLLNLMKYKDGTTIKKHIPADLYDKASKIIYNANANYVVAQLDTYKPICWTTYISEIYLKDFTLHSNYSADTYFITMAKKDGKTISPAETSESISMLNIGLSEELQIFLLRQMVNKSPEEYKKQYMDIYDAWALGAHGYIENTIYSQDGYTKDELKLVAEYNKVLIEDRNIKIAEMAEEYLAKNSKVFVSVDIENMVGEKGIVKILTDAGYKVEQIHTNSRNSI